MRRLLSRWFYSSSHVRLSFFGYAFVSRVGLENGKRGANDLPDTGEPRFQIFGWLRSNTYSLMMVLVCDFSEPGGYLGNVG